MKWKTIVRGFSHCKFCKFWSISLWRKKLLKLTFFRLRHTYFLEFSANNLGGWHWSWLIYGGGWLDISHFRFFFTDDLPFSHSTKSIILISRKNCEKYDYGIFFFRFGKELLSDQFHLIFLKVFSRRTNVFTTTFGLCPRYSWHCCID